MNLIRIPTYILHVKFDLYNYCRLLEFARYFILNCTNTKMSPRTLKLRYII